MTISNNSEILFLYDAKMSNPNGDMDNENKPRMDYDTDTNLVSDVRLKRYLRDYFEQGLKKPIFVSSSAKDAKDRKKQMEKESLDYTDLIDVKLFGAVFAATGANTHITGPVQFNWGYSLNPVEINESSTITSSFSSGEGIGKDFRVKYSLLAFSGGVNSLRAQDSKLDQETIELFDKAMIKAIPFNRTRSKTGQTPRFYLRVQAKDNQTNLKDLRKYLELEYKTENKFKIRDVKDYRLDINKLQQYFIKNQDKIEKIVIWKDDLFEIKDWQNFKEKFSGTITILDI